jgi:hypothetical protein
MSLAGQWKALGSELPDGWSQADLRLELRDAETAGRAAALLGPAQPFRSEPTVLRLAVAHDGSTVSPDALTRLLARLDEARIAGTLTPVGSERAAARSERQVILLADSWREALSGLPSDWSDLLGEIELLSSDYIERAAVLCIQMNPRRDGNRSTLVFRAARKAGYGVSPQMATRCLERCDAEQIRGSVSVMGSLSDTHHVATQGPVWHIAGKTL